MDLIRPVRIDLGELRIAPVVIPASFTASLDALYAAMAKAGSLAAVRIKIPVFDVRSTAGRRRW